VRHTQGQTMTTKTRATKAPDVLRAGRIMHIPARVVTSAPAGAA
jgi:hypothetical protein